MELFWTGHIFYNTWKQREEDICPTDSVAQQAADSDHKTFSKLLRTLNSSLRNTYTS